ncbi:hypothetical protein FE257_004720 [Aspergillus nanangensis]|uniref:BZIP domain-containing protein n=1 Tax=Aspergillus nanangensis TaxID=2582783 RepID=A0AAD4GZL6_ASPNN|nr:hypothetical protein FE257_004720 [Aspergillus nanangensis]
MAHQLHSHLNPETPTGEVDDWKGLTDPKERRRRQNRINQRAFRQRKQGRRSSPKEAISPPTIEEPSERVLVLRQQPPQQKDEARCLNNAALATLLEQFSSAVYQSYILGLPHADHLLTLSKVNVFRAFATNMKILGMAPGIEWMHDDAISPFNTMQPGFIEDSDLPVALRPTTLQLTIQHHPWLDFFPYPRMRDNLVLAGDGWDDEQLCVDIMGFWDESVDSGGLLVWGEPSDPDNWEVTEQFLRKYPWLVRGCQGLIEATNRWRATRGENLIFRYL